MAVIGVTIAFRSRSRVILGPVLNGWVGVPGIFWLTGLLALLASPWSVPSARSGRKPDSRDAEPVASQFGGCCTTAVTAAEFRHLTLHLLLTATFVACRWRCATPVCEREALGGLPAGAGHLDGGDIPFVIMPRSTAIEPVFLGRILTCAGPNRVAGPARHRAGTAAASGLLHCFNLLEATLPSLIARWRADARARRWALFSSQFGAFAAAPLGGWLRGLHGIPAVSPSRL